MHLSSLLRASSALLALALAAGASAHDAWIEARDGAYAVLYGHGDKHAGYAPEKVKAVAALDAVGAALPVNLAPGAAAVRVAVRGQAALLTLHFDNGIWTRTTDGSKNLPKNEVPGALSASHSLKFGKTVLAWGDIVTKPQGQRLEILPLSAAAPAAGGTLAVRVLWEGKPLAGAKLVSDAYGKGKTIETDAEGKATIPVVAGRHLVGVNHKRDLSGDPRADAVSVAANIVFEAR